MLWVAEWFRHQIVSLEHAGSNPVPQPKDGEKMKKCYRCLEVKSLDNFSLKSKKTGKLSSYCRPCWAARWQDYYKKGNNRAIAIVRNKQNKAERSKKNFEYVDVYKTERGCCRCGYDADPCALDFHHVGDKEFSIAKEVSAGGNLDLIKKEIEACIILCAICHRIEHKKR